ncbi:MAG: 4Fe-4S binding protein [Planctomycetes bacterium]|nr:4Fe-4S binding protein [Planctomycetota bacterium]
MRVPIWPCRRSVQVLVLLSLFAFPLLARYRHYLYARQLDKLTESWSGTAQGKLLNATDAAVRVGIPDGEGGVPSRRPRRAILERTQNFHGSAWSARVFGVSMTDPLAGAECALASRACTGVLLVGLAIPLVATLLLGRIYCGWICPMDILFGLGFKIRKLLELLEIRPWSVRFWKGSKVVLLGVGLLFALACGLPLLHYLYPPALLGREAHGFVTALFDRAEKGHLGWALAGMTAASLFLLGLLLADIAMSPRFWCNCLCPGGALYSLLGCFRLLKVRRDPEACTLCSRCNEVCPRALKPMVDPIGMECDNCGLCVEVCPSQSLAFRMALKDNGFPAPGVRNAPREEKKLAAAPKNVVTAALLGLAWLSIDSTQAHHILGLPHYCYDKDYPQTPVLKLVENVGNWEVQLTGFPGNPKPGMRTHLTVYITDRTTRSVYSKPLTLSVHRQLVLGREERVYGPEEAMSSQNLFKLYPTYPADGNYQVTLSFEDGEGLSTLRFPLVVGEPGSPWAVVFGSAGGLACFLVVVRAVRIKRARRRATPVAVTP